MDDCGFQKAVETLAKCFQAQTESGNLKAGPLKTQVEEMINHDLFKAEIKKSDDRIRAGEQITLSDMEKFCFLVAGHVRICCEAQQAKK